MNDDDRTNNDIWVAPQPRPTETWVTPGLRDTTLTNRQRNILRDRLNGHSWLTIANAYNIHEATARGHHRAALNNIERARKDHAA